MKSNASIFDKDQLTFRADIKTAIYNHYGWKNDGTKWVNEGGRPIPDMPEKMGVKRHDFFVRKHAGTDKTLSFFDVAADGNAPEESNFKDVSLPAKQFYVIAGVQMLTSGGLVGDTVSGLSFGEMGESEIENGTFTMEVNGKKVLDTQPIKSLFHNDDAIPGYFRFPQLIVWEPQEKMEARLTLQTAAGDFWIDVKTLGFLVG